MPSESPEMSSRLFLIKRKGLIRPKYSGQNSPAISAPSESSASRTQSLRIEQLFNRSGPGEYIPIPPVLEGYSPALLLLEGDLPIRLRAKKTRSKKRREGAEKPERGLYCYNCGNLVTSERQRIEVNGRHIHQFVNPYRVTYKIGCFKRAPGCVPEGPFETVWTWFPGYSWQIQLCSQCKHHLGWKYLRGGRFFFGLVLDYLTDKTGE